MASQLRVNKSENRSGLGTITYTDTGAIVSGIVTANSFSGGLPITGGSSWRVVTSSDASTLKGETNLQFDGTNLYISDNIIHKDDTNTKIGFPAVDTFTVETAGNEALRINSSGKTILHGGGATGNNNTATILENGNTLNIHGTSSSDGISVVRYSADYGAYGINIGKSNNSTFGTNTLVTDGEELGHVSFYGADGTDFNMASQITGLVDGSPATGGDATDMPGALSFRTSAEGSDSPTERLRITSGGDILLGTDHATIGANTSDGSDNKVWSLCGGSDASQSRGAVITLYGNEAALNSDYGILSLKSGNTSTGRVEFYTQGNERLRIDSSGNIGQAVTPSGWASAQAGDFYAYQIGTGMAIFGRGSGDEDRGGISCNYYNTASASKYIGNGHAGRIYFEDGSIVFSNAGQNSSGANQPLTLNHRLKIASDGKLLLGTTDSSGYNNRCAFFHNGNHGDAWNYVSITGATNGGAGIVFGDATNQSAGNYESYMYHNNTDHHFNIVTAQDTKFFRFYNTGDFGVLNGRLGVGAAPTEQLYVSKNHNGHTRAVIQNNWGANATAQLKLVSPTDELQLIKYASGAAAINLSNNSTIYASIGGAERLKIRGDSTGQTTHIVNTPSPGGNGVASQYVTQPYAMSGNYTNFRVTVTQSSWGSFFLKLYVSGYSGDTAHRWVTGYINNGLAGVRTVLANDSGDFGSGSITHISGQSWRYDISVNSGSVTHPVMLVELAVGGNGNVLGNGAVVCAIT